MGRTAVSVPGEHHTFLTLLNTNYVRILFVHLLIVQIFDFEKGGKKKASTYHKQVCFHARFQDWCFQPGIKPAVIFVKFTVQVVEG